MDVYQARRHQRREPAYSTGAPLPSERTAINTLGCLAV